MLGVSGVEERNVREGFPREVTIDWVLRDTLEFTWLIVGMWRRHSYWRDHRGLIYKLCKSWVVLSSGDKSDGDSFRGHGEAST